MASSLDFVEYVCEQIIGVGEIRFRKMFGEYMVYVSDKPLLLICDNTVYVKMLDCVRDMMTDAPIGQPYSGAKPHYILDVDNSDLAVQVVLALEKVVPVPKPKKKKV